MQSPAAHYAAPVTAHAEDAISFIEVARVHYKAHGTANGFDILEERAEAYWQTALRQLDRCWNDAYRRGDKEAVSHYRALHERLVDAFEIYRLTTLFVGHVA